MLSVHAGTCIPSAECYASDLSCAMQVPDGVDAMKVITNAMDKYKVEIAGGLGPSVGKVWRVGILGYNAQPQNIQLVLDIFRDGLKQQGKL
jgi:alanine-glyoxylate transaminase / serine-glyoxylate transaminase / serine-pyruvate transaminase